MADYKHLPQQHNLQQRSQMNILAQLIGKWSVPVSNILLLYFLRKLRFFLLLQDSLLQALKKKAITWIYVSKGSSWETDGHLHPAISLQVNVSAARTTGSSSACYISFAALGASPCMAGFQICLLHFKCCKPTPSVTEWLSSPETCISPANQARFPREIKSNAIWSKWLSTCKKNNIRFAKVQLQVEVKPFLTSTQRQRSQKNYSIKLRAGRCTAQHNSLHVAPHTAIFSKWATVALHPLLEKKPKTRTFTVSVVLRKELKRRKQENITRIVLVTLEPKCCVLSVIKEPSYSDL